MLVIGVTGGIGTGKSEVSRYLGQRGASLIDADRVGHSIYLPDTQGWREVVEAFGEDILLPTREVDRRKLGSLVFGNPGALEKLNRITHPKIRQRLIELIQQEREQGTPVVVLEAAILIEAGWADLADEVWVTTASPDVVVQRIQQRNNLPEEQVRSRIRAQMSEEERAKHATVVIENNNTLEKLHATLDDLWESRIAERTKGPTHG